MSPPQIRLRFYLLALLITAATGCTSPESQCQSDADCDGDRRCIRGGGFLVAGGRCISPDLLDVGTPDAADTTAARDAGRDTTDTSPIRDGVASDTCRTEITCRSDTARTDADTRACVIGNRRPCYTGPAGTADVGRCRSGQRRCEKGEWDARCIGERTPRAEACGNDLDDDCDGTADESCPCNYNSNVEGVCGDATTDDEGTCVEPTHFEASESSCEDGRDNDCDGEADAKDPDCKQAAGEPCATDRQCRSTCRDGTCAHRIFVTSTTYNGNLGGLGNADAHCDNVATAAGLGGTWKAVLSDPNTAARDRLRIAGSIVRSDGKSVATGAADLWDGELARPIELDEHGTTVESRVWTGSNADGTSDGTNLSNDGEYCDVWQSASPDDEGEAGYSGRTDARWAVFPANAAVQCRNKTPSRNCQESPTCDHDLPLYCIDGQ